MVDGNSGAVVLLHVWRVPPRAIPRAVARMATDRLRLRGTPGLAFHKLLGTGDGRTFDVRDADLRTWALLTAWEDRDSAGAFEAHATPRGWRRIAEEEWCGHMTPIRSRGSWGGRPAFAADAALAATWRGPVAAITRARIRTGSWARFWRAVPPVVADLATGSGPLVRIGIGEAPIGVQGTFTLWAAEQDLRDFAHRRGPHRRVIAETAEAGWYAEELFARLAVHSERGRLFGEDRTRRHVATGAAGA